MRQVHHKGRGVHRKLELELAGDVHQLLHLVPVVAAEALVVPAPEGAAQEEGPGGWDSNSRRPLAVAYKLRHGQVSCIG